MNETRQSIFITGAASGIGKAGTGAVQGWKSV
jgi:NADP-dependent 3-hydroxy acid dehydrogenase YdfG